MTWENDLKDALDGTLPFGISIQQTNSNRCNNDRPGFYEHAQG